MSQSCLRQFRFGIPDGKFAAFAGVCGRTSIAGLLCVLMAEQPLLAEAVVTNVPVKTVVGAELTGDARVLHALNRLTFGPRPGDVAAVKAMGLNKWFEMQLNPAAIDDAKLDEKLLEYPAMQMSVADLERKYPSPLMLRAMMTGKQPLPSNPVERAMVADQIEFYKMQKAKQEAAGAAKKADAAGMMMAGGNTLGGRDAAGGDAAAGDAAENKMAEKVLLASEPGDPNMMQGDAAGKAKYPRENIGRILAQTPDERMTIILAMPAEETAQFRQSLAPQELLQLGAGMTPQQRETLLALPGSLRMVALESMESRLMRDAYSDRQLEAVMTDFWLNHFNVYMRKNQNEPYLIPTYERETIRPHALGRFEDLLVATARSPAMLEYLDNFRSIGPDSLQATKVKRNQGMNPNGKQAQAASAGLNENYGRELMELHTLGVGGGYTQQDVTQVAKVFTGWTIDKPYQGGGYTFDEKRHEPGSKLVLGHVIQQAGETEGMEVLHMLATSPATAHFISEKLAVRFVSDTPPPALVDRMAQTFLTSKGDIKSVLRTMFQSPEFWAPAVYRAKVKTPLEFVISAVRAGQVQVNNPATLVQALDKLGMPLYGMQTPNGYSWKKDEWVGTGALVSRMNFSLVLTGNRMAGSRTQWTQLLNGGQPSLSEGQGVVAAASFTGDMANPAAAKELKLEQILLGESVSDRTRATVLSQSGDASVTEQAATQFGLGGGGGKGNYLPKSERNAGQQGNGPGNGLADDPQAAVMAGLLLGSPEFQRR